jgi:hypothetical protein
MNEVNFDIWRATLNERAETQLQMYLDFTEYSCLDCRGCGHLGPVDDPRFCERCGGGGEEPYYGVTDAIRKKCYDSIMKYEWN